jgi:serine/threonine-protein kinase
MDSVLQMLDIIRAHAALGNHSEVEELAERILSANPPESDAITYSEIVTGLAETYTLMNDSDNALAYLEEALNIPADISIKSIEIDPFWDPLRDLPDFNHLLRKYSP